MIGSAIVATGSAWLLGVLCVSALWPRSRSVSGDLLVILSLGIGVGFGVTSALFFAASLVSAEPMRVSAALEMLAAAGLVVGLWRRGRASRAAPHEGPVSDFWLSAILGSVFVQACLIALVATVRAYQFEPYSNSDGWTIWNMHARILFRGGEGWASLLQAPQLAWTHPDYPLLVPASVARGWASGGEDAPFVSGVISTMFGMATVGLLVGAVMRLRNRVVALTGGLVLLGTPFFVTFSSNQHADIPLGFYMLATLVLIVFGNRAQGWGLPVLAGAAAGMAAWTKNEGMLFIVATGGAWGVCEWARGSRRAVGAFGGGLGMALLPVLYFKIMLAPMNDIVSSQPWERLHHLLDWSRHEVILSSVWRDVGRFGEWRIVPFLAMVLPLLGRGWSRISRAEWMVALVLVLMAMGFYLVYLLTHWDLAEHLDSSLVRLLLQLWPGTVFFWCLAVTYEGPASVSMAGGSVGGRRRALAVILLANIVAAVGVLIVLARQPASNQLAAAHINGANIKLLIGEGWFGRESHGRDVWAWSKGTSALLLHVDAEQSVTVSLRFSMRALGARRVTASLEDQVVWRGIVDDEIVSVQIAGLALQPGITAIEFQTDAPGVLESSDPEARALTYALYNPKVE